MSKTFNILGHVSIMAAILTAVYVAFMLTRTHTYWFEYYAITSIYQTYELKDHPKFVSHNTINHVPHTMIWRDVLQCDLDNDDVGFLYYSFYPTSYTQDTLGDKFSDWVYNSITPDEPATCFIDSTICVDSFGKDVCQKIESNKFRFE